MSTIHGLLFAIGQEIARNRSQAPGLGLSTIELLHFRDALDRFQEMVKRIGANPPAKGSLGEILIHEKLKALHESLRSAPAELGDAVRSGLLARAADDAFVDWSSELTDEAPRHVPEVNIFTEEGHLN